MNYKVISNSNNMIQIDNVINFSFMDLVIIIVFLGFSYFDENIYAVICAFIVFVSVIIRKKIFIKNGEYVLVKYYLFGLMIWDSEIILGRKNDLDVKKKKKLPILISFGGAGGGMPFAQSSEMFQLILEVDNEDHKVLWQNEKRYKIEELKEKINKFIKGRVNK